MPRQRGGGDRERESGRGGRRSVDRNDREADSRGKRRRSRSPSEDRRRDKGRDRDRGGGRDRDRSRSRDRGGDRYGRDRDRDRDRDTRDRDRDRDRGGGGGREDRGGRNESVDRERPAAKKGRFTNASKDGSPPPAYNENAIPEEPQYKSRFNKALFEKELKGIAKRVKDVAAVEPTLAVADPTLIVSRATCGDDLFEEVFEIRHKNRLVALQQVAGAGVGVKTEEKKEKEKEKERKRRESIDSTARDQAAAAAAAAAVVVKKEEPETAVAADATDVVTAESGADADDAGGAPADDDLYGDLEDAGGDLYVFCSMFFPPSFRVCDVSVSFSPIYFCLLAFSDTT